MCAGRSTPTHVLGPQDTLRKHANISFGAPNCLVTKSTGEWSKLCFFCLGSDLDHKIKAAAAGKEPAWAKTGKEAYVHF